MYSINIQQLFLLSLMKNYMVKKGKTAKGVMSEDNKMESEKESSFQEVSFILAPIKSH